MRCRTSQVSALELIVGAQDNRDLSEIDVFLSAYVIVPLRSPPVRERINSSSGTQNLMAFTFIDSLVAATALEDGLTLVTKNRRHFGMIEGLILAVPQY